MPKNPNKLTTDLQGASRLTIEAVSGITSIVESMHQTITSMAGAFGGTADQRTNGVTGLVYRNIRTITDVTGGGIDILFNQLSALIGEKEPSPAREAVVAALNGVLGDHLAATYNPLAIPMRFRRDGIPLEEDALSETLAASNGNIAILVHGSCMNDLQWNRDGHDHGAALARDLGFTPVYLHYNTGLHISENGAQFAGLLESLIDRSPKPVSLFIVAHSMGGLVTRSACHYGKQSGHAWLNQLQKIVFLGTPHHGAPLEKGGSWIDLILSINPYSAPFSRLGKIRSSGVTDLRYGNVADDDWRGRDRFESPKDHRTPMPLPEDVKCYAIGATIAQDASMLADDLIGDGLVTLKSALGRHQNPDFDLRFPETHQWTARNMNHLDLLDHPDVYETIKYWLSAE